MEFNETVIDHVGGIGCSDDWCGISTGEKWLAFKLEQLAKKYPSEVECISKNKDGSVYYHIPWNWVKIRRPPVYTQEQLERFTKTLQGARGYKQDSPSAKALASVYESNLRESVEDE